MILRTLEEAKIVPDSTVVFEGDFGGIIWALVPVSLINCSEKELNDVMNIFNAFEFQEYDKKDWEGYLIYYISESIDKILESYDNDDYHGEHGLWIHRIANHLRPQIESILYKKNNC